MKKTLRRLAIGLASAALWPAYLLLVSVIARWGPWPRSLGRPLGFILTVLALTTLGFSLLRWALRREGWLQTTFDLPSDVLRQLRRAKFALLICATAFLLPEQVLARGLITSGGRPVLVPTIGHLLIIGFEAMAWVGLLRLLRPSGPVGLWMTTSPEPLGWVGRHRRAVRGVLLVALGGVIGLEALGYGFTARRVALAGVQSIVLMGVCWALHRMTVSVVSKNAWRWLRREAKIAAKANDDSLGPAADFPARLRHLCDWGVPIVGGLVGLWVWDVDLALFNYLGGQTLWQVSEATVTVANVATSFAIFALTAGAWRYLGTIFVLVVYPRMPEDPGIRFALLTLTRYFVLAAGVLAGLSCLHLGLDKIGVVLAALGVGLGFGLQEIVSNFVSGIILLLERPIRVGDVVTVASMTGKVDRINIRATTLINADNQSLIVPNREFITGNLVNWTHKDKVIRVTLQVHVALGTDPDRVSELLLGIARDDSDVLGNPVPSAYLDAFGPSFLSFTLFVYVPDPSFPLKVKHRICTQIQKKFAAAGIVIPLPLHELRVDPAMLDSAMRGGQPPEAQRAGHPGSALPPPHLGHRLAQGLRSDPGPASN